MHVLTVPNLLLNVTSACSKIGHVHVPFHMHGLPQAHSLAQLTILKECPEMLHTIGVQDMVAAIRLRMKQAHAVATAALPRVCQCRPTSQLVMVVLPRWQH